MAYNRFLGSPALKGTSGTGLDQIVGWIASDKGLVGGTTGAGIEGGAAAANGIIGLIADAVKATPGLAAKLAAGGSFSTDDVLAVNTWIRSDPARLSTFTAFHGDDEGGVETGFHQVQGDGGVTAFRGQNAINTVADGIFHIGFAVKDGRFLNEDGNANATVGQVADWLSALWIDHSATGTGLDRMADLIVADPGLAKAIPLDQIAGGANAANGISGLIANGIATLHLADDGWINEQDVRALNTWIRNDAGRLATFTGFHGDDENGVETGFHLVQGDGGNTTLFGKNFVNTVADGTYHIGFAITGDRFVNEDGAANATVTDVATWINYFYTDLSTTGTGLDFITDAIKSDMGLARNTSAAAINKGAASANGLNLLLVEGLTKLGATADGVITPDEVRALNGWVRGDAARLTQFITLHGKDEDGLGTGFHLVEGDGGSLLFRGKALIDTVADGLFHYGFAIQGDMFVNEAGVADTSVATVAGWLNTFMFDKPISFGGDGTDALTLQDDDDTVYALGGNDVVQSQAGNDTIWAGDGDDIVAGGLGNDQIAGEAGADVLQGGAGDDKVDGGDGGDVLFGEDGNDRLGGGNDADTLWGGTGNDTVSGDAGADMLAGDAGNDSVLGGEGDDLAFGGAGNDVLQGDVGNDTLFGEAGDDRLQGGAGNDVLWGNDGNDSLDGGDGDELLAGGAGNDTLVGGNGYDALLAGDGADLLDGGEHADLLAGEAGNDTLIGGGGDDREFGAADNDSLVGGDGADFLAGEAGNDTSLGGEGNDTILTGAGNDLADGGGGDDLVAGESGDDSLGGGDGNDLVWGGIGNDTLDGGIGQDSVFGEDGNDVMSGGAGQDTLWAGSGNDAIDGGDGDDIMSGQTGNDTLTGGTGQDTGWGGEGHDSIAGGDGNDLLFGEQGNDTMDGGDGTDTIWAGSGNDTVSGGAQNDMLVGEDGMDTMAGGAGDDRVFGGNDNDRLMGQDGNDSLWGEAGNDTLDGGTGADILFGGSGRDVFQFAAAGAGTAMIADFTHGSDVIQLYGSAFATGSAALAAASYDAVRGGVVITLDADSSMLLLGVQMSGLSASDFLIA